MTQASRQMSRSASWVNEFVVDLLSTMVIVLAGIVAVAQFAYY